jgi:hypothetical protein
LDDLMSVAPTALGQRVRHERPRGVAERVRFSNGPWAATVAAHGPFRIVVLLDDDRALHAGVELAEVVVGAGGVEGLLEGLAGGKRADWRTSRSCAVAVWGTGSSLVQETVPPTGTVISSGS